MNSFKKASIIATIIIAATSSAFASMTPHEHNRQITRGNGVNSADSVEFATVQGSKATPHTVIRNTRVASQRKTLRKEVNSSRAAQPTQVAKSARTPFQKNRNS